MNDTLKQLYNRFYTPLPMAEAEQEIEDCHRQLIERLEKPERKLVLRIMDTQKLRLIRVSKVVFDPKEDVMDKMTSFYGSLYNLSATAAVFIRGFKSSVEFYFATRSDFAAPLAGEIMTSTLTGNFPGIDIESFTVDETSKPVSYTHLTLPTKA